MSEQSLKAKIKELRELQRMAEELAQEIETIKDVVKAEMTARNVTELVTGEYKVRYTAVKNTRFDTTAFKATHKDLYDSFAKESVTRRFSIA